MDPDRPSLPIYPSDPNSMAIDNPPIEELPDSRGQKRICTSKLPEFAEPRKRHKPHEFSVCIPSQSLEVKYTALLNRVSKLEMENCALKDELDRMHCVSKLRYHQVMHLDNIVQQLCSLNGLDFSDLNYSDPDYFSRTEFTNTINYNSFKALSDHRFQFGRRSQRNKNANLVYTITHLLLAFRALPTEVISRIISLVDNQDKKNLKLVCQWWNQATKDSVTSLTVQCSSGMRALMGYPRLQKLTVIDRCIMDSDYQGGKHMQQLTTLILNSVTSVPFTVISQLPYLRHFELHSSAVTSVEGLELMRHLEVLVLDSIVASFTFPVSACHPKLKRICLRECLCLTLQTRFLGCCKDLEFLHIDSPLSSAQLDLDFVYNTPSLSNLAIISCCGEQREPISLEPLTSLKQLQYLNLRGFPDLDYTPVARIDSLRHIVPGLCCELQLSQLLSESKFASSLRNIEFFENEDLRDEGLALLPRYCPSLHRVIIIDCQSVTQNCIESLRKLPHLCCLHLSPQSWWSSFDNLKDFKALCRNVFLEDL